MTFQIMLCIWIELNMKFKKKLSSFDISGVNLASTTGFIELQLRRLNSL